MTSQVRHTGLVVRSIDRAMSFYCDLLGLELLERREETGDFIEVLVRVPGVRLEWAKLRTPEGSGIVELLQYHGREAGESEENYPSDRHGCSHIAFTVKDAGEIYRTLCERGIDCNSPPQQSPDGKVKVFYCHDYDGILVELVEELNKVKQNV